MNSAEPIIATLASLVFLLLVFVPMEKVFPAKLNQRVLRPNWILDLCYFIGQYLLWNTLILWALSYFRQYLNHIIPIEFRVHIQSLSIWLQAFIIIITSDFIIYWGHRLQHNVDFLWRFHKVHHSAEHMDWLAAHREHPLDTIYTVGLINLPAFILGFPLEAIAGVIAFRGIWAIYIHSNVKFPIGYLRVLIGAPELHHWHHDRDKDAGNYGNISPIMDKLFGTYTCPVEEPKTFGIKESFPKNYIGQLIYPIIPAKLIKRIKELQRRKKSSIA